MLHNQQIITRFAPSPTGYLHIGNARTALFNYLFAKRHNGKFLLRIEDTNSEKSSKEATEAIFTSLKWLGLEWDGEVIFQSQRSQIYKEAALKLLKEEKAYYCFASQEEIEVERNVALSNKKSFIFKSKWRDAKVSDYPLNIKPVIRLKAPHTEGFITIRDEVQGDVIVQNSHLDDMILLRSDDSATYMLAAVIDDHLTNVTHIIRGDDHLTNAARQILLYQAFGYSIPIMAHIPLIHDMDGTKLSKRHGSLWVEAYKDLGYLPEALCNYLLRLGWSHGDDEIISHAQAIEWFNIEAFGKASPKLDIAKMRSVNAHYLRNMNEQALTNIIVTMLERNYEVSAESKSYITDGLNGLKVRAELINDLLPLAKIYLVEYRIEYSQEALEIILNCDIDHICQVIKALERLEDWHKPNIQLMLKNLAILNDIKFNKFIEPIRALLTGATISPSIFEIISIIGKIHSVNRLKIAL